MHARLTDYASSDHGPRGPSRSTIWIGLPLSPGGLRSNAMPKCWMTSGMESIAAFRGLVQPRWLRIVAGTAFLLSFASHDSRAIAADSQPPYLSPCGLAASPDGTLLYVTCATGRRIQVVDTATHKITRTISVPEEPTGLALSASGNRLYVTCADLTGTLYAFDRLAGKVETRVTAGAGACAPVVDAQQNRIYVCSRFVNQISVIDGTTTETIARIDVVREPIAAALTADGRLLLVVNHLPLGPANAACVSAVVSLIDTRQREVVATIALPNGSTDLQGVAISPAGTVACVTHTLARYNLPTTQIERGWMCTSALTFIDLAAKKWLNTVLLDDVDCGAANPWDVAWTSDSRFISVTHAGTHELSIIRATDLLTRLTQAPTNEVPNDLAFLAPSRRRVRLPGNGPRAMALLGSKAWIAEYFSDTLTVADLASGSVEASVVLGPKPQLSPQRRGEILFNDATICFQGWQSCASCHPEARTHGLNWDLLNDGLGNPKNSKSMLLAHRTPPAMSLAIRETAETAVRSGIRNVLLSVRPETDAVAIDEYLKSLKPVPSPWLVNGQLSAAAVRGKALFLDPRVGCVECHVPELYTNLKAYDVGTRGPWDAREDKFDTPTLVEVWRTGPYLHDGSAVTIRDVITTHNPHDRHGRTAHLSRPEIEDLAAYVLSL